MRTKNQLDSNDEAPDISSPEDEIPQSLVTMANWVFVAGVLFFLLVGSAAIYRIFNPLYSNTNYYGVIALVGFISSILFLLGLRLSSSTKVNLSVSAVAIFVCVYLLEMFFHITDNSAFGQKQLEQVRNNKRHEQAIKWGVDFDHRTKFKVVSDLREAKVDAYPTIVPGLFLATDGVGSDTDKIYPFGGISDRVTVMGNENGYFPLYRSDEHGFNNPPGLYKSGQVDVVLLGDSFTHGSSVHAVENIGGVLRDHGLVTVNLGYGTHGPLMQHATLREYARDLRPKTVCWLFYEGNDLIDFTNELGSTFLMQYLNDQKFTQNLSLQQEKIDRVLIDYQAKGFMKQSITNYLDVNPNPTVNEIKENLSIENEEFISEIMNNFKNHRKFTLRSFLSLHKVRKNLNLKPDKIIEKQRVTDSVLKSFENLLSESSKVVSSWNGEMYFVYLPAYWRYYQVESDGSSSLSAEVTGGFFYESGGKRDLVLEIVDNLGIKIIDLHKIVFEQHKDPLSLFPFRLFGHYNSDGYKLSADAIARHIR